MIDKFDIQKLRELDILQVGCIFWAWGSATSEPSASTTMIIIRASPSM